MAEPEGTEISPPTNRDPIPDQQTNSQPENAGAFVFGGKSYSHDEIAELINFREKSKEPAAAFVFEAPAEPAPTPLPLRSATIGKGGLRALALEHYGDESLAQAILDANRNKLKDLETYQIGQTVILPHFPAAE